MQSLKQLDNAHNLVMIETRAGGDNVFISITDNGDSISPERKYRI